MADFPRALHPVTVEHTFLSRIHGPPVYIHRKGQNWIRKLYNYISWKSLPVSENSNNLLLHEHWQWKKEIRRRIRKYLRQNSNVGLTQQSRRDATNVVKEEIYSFEELCWKTRKVKNQWSTFLREVQVGRRQNVTVIKGEMSETEHDH